MIDPKIWETVASEKAAALLRLWGHALSSLEFNHPDSRVYVIPHIELQHSYNFVNISLRMHMLRKLNIRNFYMEILTTTIAYLKCISTPMCGLVIGPRNWP